MKESARLDVVFISLLTALTRAKRLEIRNNRNVCMVIWCENVDCALSHCRQKTFIHRCYIFFR